MISLTPQKKTQQIEPATASSKILAISRLQTPSIDYKQKTLELIHDIFDLQSQDKRNSFKISQLEEELSQAKKQINSVYQLFGCSSKKQLLLWIQNHNLERDTLVNESLEKQRKFTKGLKQNRKQCIHDELKLSLSNYCVGREEKASKEKQDEIKVLKEELQTLLCENSNLKEEYELIEGKFRQSIEKFENISNIIEEKVKEYCTQIQQYKSQIREYQQKIKELSTRRDGEQKQYVETYSFGNKSEQGDGYEKIDNECLQVSIDGLISENKRLKRMIETLFKMNAGEEVDEGLRKEVEIMKKIVSLNQEN